MKNNVFDSIASDIKKYKYELVFNGIKYSTQCGSFSWEGSLTINKRLKGSNECVYKMPCSEKTLQFVLKKK